MRATLLFFNAAARHSAPDGPIWFLYKLSVVNTYEKNKNEYVIVQLLDHLVIIQCIRYVFCSKISNLIISDFKGG